MGYKVQFFDLSAPATKYPLHDPTLYEDFVLLSARLSIELNAAGSFSFTIAQNNPYYNNIQYPMFQVVEVLDQRGRWMWEGRIISISVDTYGQKNVECEGILSVLSDTFFTVSAGVKNVTPTSALTAWLRDHNVSVVTECFKFALGNVDNNYAGGGAIKVTGATKIDTTPFDAISEYLISNCGGFVKVRKSGEVLVLDYSRTPGSSNAQAILYGDNMISFSRRRNLSDVFTAVVPIGKDMGDSKQEFGDERLTIESVNGGKMYLSNHTLTNQFGWIFKVITNSDIDDANDLKNWGQDYLNDHISDFDRVVVECTALDLSYVSSSETPLTLGSYVHVKSPVHDFDATLPISSMTIDIIDPGKTRYTLGLEKSEKLTGLVR